MTTDEYIEEHIDSEPEHLRRLYRRTHLSRLYPRMCTDHIQGRLLAMLTAMIKPRRILELGTFTGYSTLCFAESLAPGGHIDTIELDDEYADELEALFADAAPGKITVHYGDAEALMPALMQKHSYDLVFIDANKRRYKEYYHIAMTHLRSGAYIFADNTLWDDKVCNAAASDSQTRGIRAFNDAVAADSRVCKVMIPVRDGLTVIRRK